VAGLRQAMRSRGLIEQAKGMLAVQLDCDPESAFAHLVELSQKRNVPVINVAADIVGAAVPEPVAEVLPESLPPAAVDLRGPSRPRQPIQAIIDAATDAAPTRLSTERTRLLQRTATAMASATDLDEVAQALLSLGLADLDASATGIFAAEADRAVRLLASHGWSAHVVSEWQRVPSQVPTTVATVMRTGQPLLVDGLTAHDFVLIGPGAARMVYPLAERGRTVGALSFIWPHPRAFTREDRDYLDQLAAAAAATLHTRWPTGPLAAVGPNQQAWLSSVLDTVYSQGHVLRPILTPDGTVEDFTIAAVTADTARSDGNTEGRRLLDVYPNLLENGVFAGYVAVANQDIPYAQTASPEQTITDGRIRRVIVNRRASRLGDSIVAAWERIDQTVNRDERLERLEALGHYGWAEWDLRAGDALWSSGLYHLLGRAGQPCTLERFVDVIAPADRRRFRALTRTLAAGHPAVAELRLLREGTPVPVLLVGEAEADEHGVWLVRLIVQDISAQRDAKSRLERSESVAAARQLQLANQRGITQALTQLLYPDLQFDLDLPAMRVLGRHTISAAPAMRGDICDAVPVGDGAMAAVGDMFGVGLAAAASVVRIRYPAMALGAAGAAPTEILSILNGQLMQDRAGPMASLLVLGIDPRSSTLVWASAGHFPPLRIRGGRATPLAGKPGPALGLLDTATFGGGRVKLRPGDIILGYTNGLIDHRHTDPLRHLAQRAGQAAKDGLSALVALTPSGFADDACVLAIEVREVAS